ncbi:hypothetical protein [Streptomyces sp. NBC_01294]|uniref:hypothetical protein n=1 Tax=Streptomyces sp. NBC_01294 TaxID=2903815 RepID=UPI002DDB78FB|nr:hypothetical protein [Streptomyces sp. NBC_01294]WRZ55203.1 hypothetical protein OG534_01015 [Streptomyces sp. NBC_01294]
MARDRKGRGRRLAQFPEAAGPGGSGRPAELFAQLGAHLTGTAFHLAVVGRLGSLRTALEPALAAGLGPDDVRAPVRTLVVVVVMVRHGHHHRSAAHDHHGRAGRHPAGALAAGYQAAQDRALAGSGLGGVLGLLGRPGQNQTYRHSSGQPGVVPGSLQSMLTGT